MVLLVLVSACTTSSASSASSTDDALPPRTLRVLQANLCDSGEARCYTGRSVARLTDVIRAESPEVVTLNEICQDDVAVLEQVLAGLAQDDVVVSAFKAARDRPTDADYRCRRNGQPYGIGVLARIPARDPDHTTQGGVYPVQDPADPEERVWVCLDAVAFSACATHLANTVPSVALAQCAHLMTTVFQPANTGGSSRTTVVGGDFNLLTGGSPDLRSCLPAGVSHADDAAAAQHIVTNVGVASSRSIDMAGTTDHPALLATLTLPTS